MAPVLLICLTVLTLQWSAPTDVLGLTTPTAAFADEQRRQPMDMRFREMDQNNDGIITRNEWTGTAESFRVHDWNRDGMLSGLELRPGTQRGRRIDEDDFDPELADDFPSWTPEGFAALDHNRDGRITANEWHFDRESFMRADRNRNGVLSRGEFIGGGVDDDRDDRFEYLDANGNGQIERAEWHSTSAAFNALDRNRNGVLSRAEVLGSEPVSATATDQFRSLDYDDNGVLTRDEWHWSRGSFEARDLNRDGALSRREYNETATAAAAPSASRVLVINPTQRWTDSGITVRAGDVITFNADGTIQLSDNPNDKANPAGSATGRRAPAAPILTAPAGGLIARIGNSAPIYVGANGSINGAPVNGRLYLGVNDDHLADNLGEYRVTVNVDRNAR